MSKPAPHPVERAINFNERVSRHLAWCMNEGHITFDRAREILGVTTETFRDTTKEWVRLGWLKQLEDPL